MRTRFTRRRVPRSHSLTARSAVVVACCLLPCSSALCQTTPPAGAAGGFGAVAPANEVTKFSGTLKDARGNVIVVTREDDSECFVQVPDRITSLSFSAKAIPAYLRRGTPVRFAMAIGPNGAPISPVEKVVIFSPLAPGAVPPSEAAKFIPGVHHDNGRQARQPGAPRGGRVDVVGTLVMINPQGAISVQAGGTPVNTMVNQNAEIEIQMNNLSLAQAGDDVEIEGFYNPPDETKVKAQRIKITTDRVIGEAPGPAKRKGRSRPGKEANTLPAEQPPAAADIENP